MSPIEALLRAPGVGSAAIPLFASGSNAASASVAHIGRSEIVEQWRPPIRRGHATLSAESYAAIRQSIAEHARGEATVLTLESLETDDE